MLLRDQVEHTARFEVLEQDTIAVKEHDWLAFASLDEVKLGAIHVDELACRGCPRFGSAS
jgi:hypothetical protein